MAELDLNDMSEAMRRAMVKAHIDIEKSGEGSTTFELLTRVVSKLSDLNSVNEKEKQLIDKLVKDSKKNESIDKQLKILAQKLTVLMTNNQSSINKNKIKGYSSAEDKAMEGYRRSFPTKRFKNLADSSNSFYEDMKGVASSLSGNNKNLRENLNKMKKSTDGITASAMQLSELTSDLGDLSKILNEVQRKGKRNTTNILKSTLGLENDADWLTQLSKTQRSTGSKIKRVTNSFLNQVTDPNNQGTDDNKENKEKQKEKDFIKMLVKELGATGFGKKLGESLWRAGGFMLATKLAKIPVIGKGLAKGTLLGTQLMNPLGWMTTGTFAKSGIKFAGKTFGKLFGKGGATAAGDAATAGGLLGKFGGIGNLAKGALASPFMTGLNVIQGATNFATGQTKAERIGGLVGASASILGTILTPVLGPIAPLLGNLIGLIGDNLGTIIRWGKALLDWLKDHMPGTDNKSNWFSMNNPFPNVGKGGNIEAAHPLVGGAIGSLLDTIKGIPSVADIKYGQYTKKGNNNSINKEVSNLLYERYGKAGMAIPRKYLANLLNQRTALDVVSRDSYYERIKGNNKYGVSDADFGNDIEYLRRGSALALERSGLSGFNITSALGTKYSPHSIARGSYATKSHYAGQTIDVVPKGKSYAQLVSEMRKSGLFEWVNVEGTGTSNHHIDAKFKDEIYKKEYEEGKKQERKPVKVLNQQPRPKDVTGTISMLDKIQDYGVQA